MSGEAMYMLSTLLLAYLIYLLVMRGGRGVVWYCWRRGRVAVEVWLTQVRANVGGGDSGGGGEDSLQLSGVMGGTPWEREMEQPKPFITDRHEDAVSVSGVDREGRAVMVRAARLSNRRASVFLTVMDKDGTVYTLPNQPDTSQVNVEGEGWGGAGLSVTCVDPMRLWRVKFSGLLRRGAKGEYITEGSEEETRERKERRRAKGKQKKEDEGEEKNDSRKDDRQQEEEDEEDEEDEEEGDIVHARLDLLWRAVRGPVGAWNVISPSMLSRALAPYPHASARDYLEEEKDGYEQWGCLHGTVRLHGETSMETWYLRGPRRHRWGLARAVGQGLITSAYFKNGDLFSLRARSLGPSSPQYVMGYLRKASGQMHVMTWCNLDLNKLDRLDLLGNNLLIKFKAGGQTYEVWQRLGEGIKYYTGDPWTCGHDLHLATAASIHSHGYALTTLSCRYTALCPVPERESLPCVVAPRDWADGGIPLVVALEDPRCRDSSLAGGKGASLALLNAYRELLDPEQEPYEVPPGVVVTSRAWEVQLAVCHDLQQVVRNLRLAAAAGQPARLKEACARAVEVCKGVEVCTEVAEDLLTCLAEVTDIETTRLAVRSSGCVEDGSESSAAGQNETVLGVAGKQHLLTALTCCWASLFTYHSVEYRRQRGQPVECGMGVVVQEMAAAEAAGVIFTADPTTGDPSSITITANYGLGESVVSAGAEPDTIVVRRNWRDSLKVTRRCVGTKAIMCVPREGGGTQEVAVGVEARERVCISDSAAFSLARVALYLHNAFAGPRDIEFALLKNETVVVLQSRPVTCLNTWTKYELVHEMDTGTLTDDEPITKGNTGEVFPGSTSPLSLSLITAVLDVGFQQHWYGTKIDTHHTLMCPSYYTHVFINMEETIYRLTEKEETAAMLTFQALDMALFGHHVTTTEFLRHARERFGVMNSWQGVYALLRLIYDKLTMSRRTVSHYQEKYKDFEVGEGRAVSASSLYAEITRHLPDLLEAAYIHIVTSKVTSSSQTIAFLALVDGRKELSKDNVSDMAMLLSSCTGVESAEVPNALKELSRVISENEEAEEFLAMSPDEARVWLQSHPGPVGAVFRQFLARHGHRSIKELDLHSLSWRLDPQTLVTTLQVMTKHPAGDPPAHCSPVDPDELLDQLRSPTSHSTRRALKFLLPMCREGVVLRETTKSMLIRVIDGLRSGYRELGALLVSEGRLPDPELVFFLKHSELGKLVTDPSPSLVAKAMGKKRLHAHLDNLRFPEISIGTPAPMKEEDESGRKQKGERVVLAGSPVCHGQVRGPARVVTKLLDADSIQSGDILVTVSTDIGWSPYFPLLAGVVTELGGIFSHGAVVAREYGLPCLVGVQGATHFLRSGDQVLLDSICGTVSLLQPVSSSSTAPSAS